VNDRGDNYFPFDQIDDLYRDVILRHYRASPTS
jgi:hypothetical protein